MYLLTEHDSVARADTVYLPEIPANVAALRKRFPAVEKVLSTYELLLPALNAANQTLTSRHVFNQLTSTKSADAFLPRLIIQNLGVRTGFDDGYSTLPNVLEECCAYCKIIHLV